MQIACEVKSNLFGKIASRMPFRASSTAEQTAKDIAKDAQSRVHVVSGDLRDSIAPRKVNEDEWVVETGVPYAAREEFGFVGTDSLGRHYHQAAHPYLTPAAEAHRSAFTANMVKVVEP